MLNIVKHEVLAVVDAAAFLVNKPAINFSEKVASVAVDTLHYVPYPNAQMAASFFSKVRDLLRAQWMFTSLNEWSKAPHQYPSFSMFFDGCIKDYQFVIAKLLKATRPLGDIFTTLAYWDFARAKMVEKLGNKYGANKLFSLSTLFALRDSMYTHFHAIEFQCSLESLCDTRKPRDNLLPFVMKEYVKVARTVEHLIKTVLYATAGNLLPDFSHTKAYKFFSLLSSLLGFYNFYMIYRKSHFADRLPQQNSSNKSK